MGRLIHTNDLHNAVMMNKRDWGIFDVTIDNLIEGVVSQVPTVEAISKADYENRLKADMVAMLEDLDLQIEALEEIPPYDIMDDWEHQICVRTWEVKQIVKEKINAMKGDT